MDIKTNIKKKLNEINMEQLYGDMKRRKANVLGLTHVAYDTYEDKQGNKFIWDKSIHNFKPNHFGTMNKIEKDKNVEVKSVSPEPEKKSVSLVKSIKDVKEPEYDVEEVENKKGYGYYATLLKSKNWGIVANKGYHDTTFKVYGDMDNIGRKGKTVRETELRMDIFQSRYFWKNTIVDKIKQVKPKTFEDVIALIKSEFKRAEQAEKENDPTKEVKVYEYNDTLKGVDSHIPDFGLEGEYKTEVGEDVGIHFEKPEINISSKSESESLDRMRMTSYTKIKWAHRKKVAAIKDQLLKAKGLGEVFKILNNAGIKYEHRSYMQAGFD